MRQLRTVLLGVFAGAAIVCGLFYVFFGRRMVAIATAERGACIDFSDLVTSLRIVGGDEFIPPGVQRVRYRDAARVGFIEVHFHLAPEGFAGWCDHHDYDPACYPREIEICIDGQPALYKWNDCCSLWFERSDGDLTGASVDAVVIDAVDVLYSAENSEGIIFIHTAGGR